MTTKLWSFLAAHKRILTLLLVLWIGVLAIRVWYAATHIPFYQDQARDVFLIQEKIRNNEWLVAYGPKASVGNFYLPPFYYQFSTFLFRLSGGHPLTMHWVITLAESFTPVVIFLILRYFLSEKGAMRAAWIYGCSFLVVHFGTFAWNPNMIPLFASLSLYGWCLYLFSKRPLGIVLGVFSLLVAFHLHYQTAVLFLFPLLVFFYSLKRNPKHILYWIVGGVCSLLLFLPYFSYEMQHSWQNTQAIVAYFTSEHSQYFDRVSKPAFIHTFLPAFVERVLIGKNISGILLGRLLFFIGMPLLVITSIKRRRVLWLLLYVLSIFLMLRLYKGDKVDYYMSTLFVLPAILFGLAIDYLPQKIRSLSIVIASVCLLLVFGKPMENGYQALQQASQFILSSTQGKPAQFIFHDDDLINTFAFTLKPTEREMIDQTSSQLIDVCGVTYPCFSKEENVCAFTRGFTYSALLKATNGYTQGEQKVINRTYAIGSGTLQNNRKIDVYPLYQTDLGYGSDTLMPIFYR